MSSPIRSTPRLDLLTVDGAMHAGIVSVPPETDLQTLSRTFAEHRIHSVVVTGPRQTDRGSTLSWGIVSVLDVMRGLYAGQDRATAGDLAATELITIEIDETLDRSAQLMAEHAITHLVVTQHGNPIGILSPLDIARAAGSS
jgi:CBS domain-containing protein